MSLSAGTLASNTGCTISLNVQGTTTGVKNNSVTVTSTEGGTGNTSNASLTVVLATPPTITKSFGVASIALNTTTSLTFNINNPNASTTLTGIAFTDTLPAGLVVATPNGLTTTCTGVSSAGAGTGSVSLSAGTLASNTSCTISVNVLGTTTGVKNNSVTVTSTEGGTGNTSNASLTVGPAALQSIAVTPANPSLAKGLTQQFTATGTFSDNSTQNITATVTWASATPGVATITAGGLATGVSTGTSSISATLSGISGSTVLTVTAAVLQSIAVTPANPSIPKGTTQPFTATGTFSDSSTQNLTGSVTWASATPSVATITAAGLATGVSTGTSSISATQSGISGSTVLTVTAAVLQSIAVTPANPSIPMGTTQQFTATGTFSDATVQNLTGSVTWASATPSVATITVAGLATGVSTGTSTISATLGGISGSTVLTVTAAASGPTVVSFNVLFGVQSYNVTGTSRNRLPWQITGIQVVFSAPITTGNINSLTGLTTTGFTGLGTTTLTWTINPVSQAALTASLLGSGPDALKDAGGLPLAGGAGFNQNLKILWADFNDDGIVNASDLVLVNNARSAPYTVFADLNGDGVVDINDVRIVGTRNGTSLP